MQKTKLGISVGLLGAISYFMAIFSGYQALLLVVGYVLLFEENEWLKKACVKALIFMLAFSAMFAVIGLIPDVFSWISSCLNIMNLSVSFSFVNKICNIITGALSIVRTIFMVVLGVKALNQGDFKVNMIDELVEKHTK